MLTSGNVAAYDATSLSSSFFLSPSPSKSANNIDDLRNLFPKGNDELSENYRLRKEDEFGKDLNRLVDMLLSKRVKKSVPGISTGSVATVSVEERGSSSGSSTRRAAPGAAARILASCQPAGKGASMHCCAIGISSGSSRVSIARYSQ